MPAEKRFSLTDFAFRPTRLAALKISSRVADVARASSRDKSAGSQEILKNAATAASDANPESGLVAGEDEFGMPISESGGAKVVHGSGGIMLLRAE
ncbi:hypothetical protein AGR5A_Cc60115 [Agrobacterium genomosp. 5 str. CFBP 6626]|nr:hypothetical protein AGR5A_Cc60115 [Agrobacterium genomosp. 5 str. CFBP 6626]